MKRFVALVIALMYLVSSVGATVQVHYCMGEKVGVGLAHPMEGKCPKCGMKKTYDKGCCKDVNTTVKNADHALSNHQVEFPAPTQLALPIHYVWQRQPQYLSNLTAEALCFYEAPPPLGKKQPIYLLVQNFRI
jgi:hypothetical protein